MLRIRHLTTAAFVVLAPLPVLADCTAFSAYNSEGNYHSDIQSRVQDALTCELWTPEFDQSTLNHTQGGVLQALLSEQRNDEAVATARIYFEDAKERYERAALYPDALDILSDNGKRYSRLTSHVQQMGMLATDVQSTLTSCDNIETLGALLALMEDDIQRDMERTEARNEVNRVGLEQRLQDYSLEDWQEYFPDAASMDDIRNDAAIQRTLHPDTQADRYNFIDRLFVSMFTTTVRVDGGTAEQCLADAFPNFAGVAGLDATQLAVNFPSVARFMQSNRLDQ